MTATKNGNRPSSSGRRRPRRGRRGGSSAAGRDPARQSNDRRDAPRGRRDSGRKESGRRDGNRRDAPRRDANREPAYQRLLRQIQAGVSIDPEERLKLEFDPNVLTTRVFELVSPIGKGQRCLIVSPPKAGKTTLLIDTARAVAANHPEISIYTLLIDERPEEVTHFRREAPGEVHAASSDLSAEDHIRVAEGCLEKALEKVVDGEDVLILLDSITRLARAYNAVNEGVGRTLSGGYDAATIQFPRRFFGSGRNIENGGSLTIIGTALVETGSKMDQVIFEEFKGTGNTEIILSRELFQRRIFPCIDIAKSGTRREEKLYPPEQLVQLQTMRKALLQMDKSLAMEKLLDLLKRYPSNEEALVAIGAALG